MPVREKLVTWLGEKFMGGQTHNGITLTCTSIGDAYYDVRDAADAAYCAIIEGVDWPRIFIESMSRHGALTDAGVHPQPRRGAQISADETCPDCLRAALLSLDRFTGWVTDGKARDVDPPTVVPDGDWARILAESLPHRGAPTRNHT